MKLTALDHPACRSILLQVRTKQQVTPSRKRCATLAPIAAKATALFFAWEGTREPLLPTIPTTHDTWCFSHVESANLRHTRLIYVKLPAPSPPLPPNFPSLLPSPPAPLPNLGAVRKGQDFRLVLKTTYSRCLSRMEHLWPGCAQAIMVLIVGNGQINRTHTLRCISCNQHKSTASQRNVVPAAKRRERGLHTPGRSPFRVLQTLRAWPVYVSQIKLPSSTLLLPRDACEGHTTMHNEMENQGPRPGTCPPTVPVCRPFSTPSSNHDIREAGGEGRVTGDGGREAEVIPFGHDHCCPRATHRALEQDFNALTRLLVGTLTAHQHG